jgi:hypothetical protein
MGSVPGLPEEVLKAERYTDPLMNSDFALRRIRFMFTTFMPLSFTSWGWITKGSLIDMPVGIFD